VPAKTEEVTETAERESVSGEPADVAEQESVSGDQADVAGQETAAGDQAEVPQQEAASRDQTESPESADAEAREPAEVGDAGDALSEKPAGDSEDETGSSGENATAPGDPLKQHEEPAVEGAMGVQRAEFQTLEARRGAAAGDSMLILMDVTVPVTIELGGTVLPLRQILDLGPGSVIRLDKPLGEPVDIVVNGELVGRGEVVVVGDQFGVQVTELVDPKARQAK
jgi:flagellar motor switch protein FliN/FliY